MKNVFKDPRYVALTQNERSEVLEDAQQAAQLELGKFPSGNLFWDFCVGMIATIIIMPLMDHGEDYFALSYAFIVGAVGSFLYRVHKKKRWGQIVDQHMFKGLDRYNDR